MPQIEPFSAEEFDALADTRFFALKGTATTRIRSSFAALREALRPEVAGDGWLCAGAVDVTAGQLTGGEDYRGLPYVVLDFPRHFSREEFLAMRTLFWWGHYVVYALILKGPWLSQVRDRLATALPALEAAGVEATLAADPWDWRRGGGWTRPLRDDADTRAWLGAAPFLKLMRFLPLAPAPFTPERIVAEGLESWVLYRPFTRRDA